MPVMRDRKKAHRPAEVPSIATARRLGEGVQPRGRYRPIEESGQRVCIRESRAADGVTAIQGNERIPGLEHSSARRQSKVSPNHSREIVACALSAKERPPRSPSVQITAAAQCVPERHQPASCERRQHSARTAVGTMRPDEIFANTRGRPFRERFTSKQGTKHLTFDESFSFAGCYTRQLSFN